VLFRVIQGPDFVRDTNTVFVIHGWNGKADDFNEFASAIKESSFFGHVQVITVDWVAAKTGVPNLKGASNWIDGMGELISNQVNSWGISPSRINIAGHSLGAYVAYEVAERLGGINTLVAMNPASTALQGYDIKQVDFSRHSRSLAFWQNGTTDSEPRALTANKSFKILLPWYNPPSPVNFYVGHGSAKLVLTNMLRGKGLNIWGNLNIWDSWRNSSQSTKCDGRLRSDIEVNDNFIATKILPAPTRGLLPRICI